MSERACDVPQHQLAEAAFADGPPAPALQAHLASCSSCRQALEGYRRAGRAMAQAMPAAESAEARRRNIDAALRAARRAAPGKQAFAWRPLFAAGSLLAAAAAVAIFATRAPAPPPETGWAVVVSGELGEGAVSVKSGSPLTEKGSLEVPEGHDARLRLPDGTEVVAAAKTRFVARAAKGTRFGLESGQLGFSVRPQPKEAPFEVETAEALVRVVGTRFTVKRTLTGLSPSTVVAVEHGVVEVRALASGEVRRLTAGESMEIPPPAEADAAAAAIDAAPAPAGPEPSLEPRQVEKPAAPRIGDIRARIQSGKLKEARALIARARAAGAGVDPAELAIVEAEAALAEGRNRAAIDGYLAIVRRFPGKPQAEEALFAAASLTVDHAERARGVELLRQYQAAYPRGRFADDVKRLLYALEGSAR